ncbi:MAG: hypothetical protein DIU78_013155 [Pseudomonadota bacterium]
MQRSSVQTYEAEVAKLEADLSPAELRAAVVTICRFTGLALAGGGEQGRIAARNMLRKAARFQRAAARKEARV